MFIPHQKTFLPYEKMFNGKEIAILATGPSLNLIYFGVNKAYKYKKVNFDFFSYPGYFPIKR